MKNKNTIGQWLNKLPSPAKEKAINNTKPERLDILPTDGNTLPDALISAFVWDESKEGFEYWSTMHRYTENPKNHNQ